MVDRPFIIWLGSRAGSGAGQGGAASPLDELDDGGESAVSVVELVVVPAGLGLLGFIEPCSIGGTLLFIRYLEDKGSARKLAETVLFAVTRGLFIGLLGVVAVLVGTGFLRMQRGAWVLLGVLYVILGVLYATRRTGRLKRTVGPSLVRLSGLRGSVGLGVLLGLNIPACAGPLLLALLAAAAARGATGATLLGGFVSLGVFGLALSLPLVVAVLFPRARGLVNRVAAWSRRAPLWVGLVLVVLGLWSIGVGLA